MNVGCVVVTYNRLSLLKENLRSLREQTYLPHKIYIIDNCSTDGTRKYLDSIAEDKLLNVVHLDKNIGGAGGFSEGIKLAIFDGCDYIWIMDDDTMPYPDALKNLIRSLSLSANIGFVCSKVVWTDGSLNKANKAAIGKDKRTNVPIVYQNDMTKAFLCTHCSFVSVMFPASVIKKVGLPLKDFFIWMDDVEYTCRIINSSYIGLYVEDSIVLHKTLQNTMPDLATAPVQTAWKFYFLARNSVYLTRLRKKNFFSFHISVLNKYRLYLHWIEKRKDGKNEKRKFKNIIKRGVKDGLKFRPSIEYLQE